MEIGEKTELGFEFVESAVLRKVYRYRGYTITRQYGPMLEKWIVSRKAGIAIAKTELMIDAKGLIDWICIGNR